MVEPIATFFSLNNSRTFQSRKHSCALRQIEPLEQRMLMAATLFVTAPGGLSDATHFQSLQSALSVALSGDSIVLQTGYDASSDAALDTLHITRTISLTADSGVTLPFNLELDSTATGVTLSHLSAGKLTIDAGSSGNSVSDSTFTQLVLKGGSHHNNFTHNTFGSVTAEGVNNASGHDTFQQNTFTATVTINGNTSTPTADSFLNNTFTVSMGDALVLFKASGTTAQGNTITDSSSFANGIVVHDADDVVLTNNQITLTGMMSTGIYIFTDGTSSTSVDVNGNTLQATGFGLYIAKYDATAALEVRAQHNDLRLNNVGAFVYGDGVTAGSVDFGGGTTRFGTSAGQNDFSSFTSANANHYAIGMFATSAGYALLGNNNFWGVADPLSVVADGTHTPAAFGTGVILGTAYVPAPPVTETLTVTAADLSGIETGTVSGVVAHFTSDQSHAAADFTVMIAWGDGSTSEGIVVASASGGFDVMASHAWSDAGNYTLTVSVTDAATSASDQAAAAISSRVISLLGTNITTSTKLGFNGVVATFTDNLPGNASGYVASVAWSDGVTTIGTIVKNADGSFSIKTNRTFKKAGVVVGSISISTLDGIFSGTTSMTATVTTNGKCEGKMEKRLACILKHIAKPRSTSHGRPAFLKIRCSK